jgi:hypothetical protein
MTVRSLSSLPVLATAALCGLVVGCGGSSSSSSSSTSTPAVSAGDKTAFCKDNAALDKATAAATTAAEALKALKDNQSTIDAFARDAPTAIKAQANVLAGDAKAAIAANNPGVFSDPKFAAAGPAVDAYCGQQANGTSTTSTSATTTPYP